MFKPFKLIDKSNNLNASTSTAGLRVNSTLGPSQKQYKSLIFNSASNQYLSRTPISAGNRKTWTLSFWFKRGSFGADQYFFGNAQAPTGTLGTYIGLASNSIIFGDYATSNYDWYIQTIQVFRDPSAWHHVVFQFDTTQSVASDRAKIFINGLRVTSFSNGSFYPSLNSDGRFNQAISTSIGRLGTYTGNDYNGYMSEIYFSDGYAYGPEFFGYFDSLGIWQPKRFSGVYGRNGFYLPFNDSSFTDLVKDKSGNNNNWSLNGYSNTSFNDAVVSDSPVNNFCSLNPLSVTSGTFTRGNLRYTGPSVWKRTNGNIAVSSGKWYWEVTLGNAPFGTASGNTYNLFGWGLSTVFDSSTNPVSVTDGVILGDNQYYKNFSGTWTSLGTSFSSGDVLACAVDLDANTFIFYRNGLQLVTGTIGGTAGRELVPVVISYDGTYGVMDCNFGQKPFKYSPPTGFKTLCSANLPVPSITNGRNHMGVVTYTGTSASQSISSLGFSPDFVWIKGRGATDHALYDTTRGATFDLVANSTAAQTTQAQGLTAFGSNGFTVGTLAKLNTNTSTYVAWAWDKSSINGIDIVTYTGNNTARTISHSLGAVPKMMIVKQYSPTPAGGEGNWDVYHASLATNQLLYLDLPNAAATNAAVWNNTRPTSSVFSVGNDNNVNKNTTSLIAYLFAEIEGYSKFGSYTGNGLADGPFVWCGFRPRWVMIKNSSSAYNWIIYDTERSTANLVTLKLVPNNAQEENGSNIGGTTFNTMDIVSNGFKLRSSNVDSNASGNILIFAAFAEYPFKYSRAR